MRTPGWRTPDSGHVQTPYAALGDRERAFQWLDKAVAGDAPQVLTLDTPMLDDLRTDPQFHQVLRGFGLER